MIRRRVGPFTILGLMLLAIGVSGCAKMDEQNSPTSIGPDQQSSSPSVEPEGKGHSTLVFVDAAVYTVSPEQPWAEAVAIRDGIILAVGSEDPVLAAAGENPEISDLGGRMVMPGFHDPHLHVVEAGINEALCTLPSEASLDEYAHLLNECAQEQDGESWVRGAGVSIPALLNRTELPIDLIDRVIPDRPAVILDDLGHGAWANTLAMEAVGYDSLDGHPQGGLVLRDPTTGHLSGVVLENAQQALRTASFQPTPENIDFSYDAFLNTLDFLAMHGITSVSDAGGYWPQGHETVWQRAEEAGRLSVRASNALYLYPDLQFDEQMGELRGRYSNDPDRLSRLNQVKIYVDGILSLGTSALYEPYQETFGLPDISSRGFLYFDLETLDRYVRELEQIGFQLHFHVTGDRGAGIALDAIDRAFDRNGITDRRHRLTHLYLIDDQDRPRFKDLGVIADFQLAPSSTDSDYADFIFDYIGERADELLPARSVLDTGARVVLSSDWDADELSPFVKIQSVLTRRHEGVPDLATAIRMMTLDAAYLLHHEDKTGSIETGKLADLIVLDQNLFDIETNKIGRTKVLLTILGGEEIYKDPSFSLDR